MDGPNSSVTTEGGPVKTVSRVIHDADQSLKTAIGSMASAVNATAADAAIASSAAQSARQAADGAEESAVIAVSAANLVRTTYTDLDAVSTAADSVRQNANTARLAAIEAGQAQQSAAISASQAQDYAEHLQNAAQSAVTASGNARTSADSAAGSARLAQNAADQAQQSRTFATQAAEQAEQATSLVLTRTAQAQAAQLAAAQSLSMVQDQTTQTLSAAENARIDAIAAHGWAEQALVARHQSQQNSDTIRAYATAYFAASLDRLAEKSARTERHSLEYLAALLLPVMTDLDRVRAASELAAQQAVGTVRTIRTLFADSLEHLVVRILSAERDHLLRSREQMLELAGLLESPPAEEISESMTEFMAALDAAMSDPAGSPE